MRAIPAIWPMAFPATWSAPLASSDEVFLTLSLALSIDLLKSAVLSPRLIKMVSEIEAIA